MNHKLKYLVRIAMLALLCILPSCRGGEGRSAHAQTEQSRELALPQVPMAITDPQSRAAYIMNHFWDSMDFCDTLCSHDMEFLEQNFVNFISIFPIADAGSRLSAVQGLMQAAEADAGAHALLCSVAEKYLYDPGSPMANDEYYVLFLRSLHGCSLLSEEDVAKYSDQLRIASKNLPGSIVADTRMLMRGGKVSTLHAQAAAAPLTILAFYDPECSHCSELLDALSADDSVGNMVLNGQLAVLALYAEGKADVWQSTNADLPQKWQVAMDIGGCLENEDFVVRASPTFYLLDSEARVLMKDAPLATIVEALKRCEK